MESQFLDIEAAKKFIESSVKHYEKTALAWECKCGEEERD